MYVYTTAEDSVEFTTRVFALSLVSSECLRHASTSLRYRGGVRVARVSRVPAHDRRVSSTSQACALLAPSSPTTPCRSLATAPCFIRRRKLSFPSLVVVSRYDCRRVFRYLLSKQWVSLTRETALKFPLTASIQAEFNIRAEISVYQQSSVLIDHVVCRQREDSLALLLTALKYCDKPNTKSCSGNENEKKIFFFRLDITLLIYV
jgi:hypothetical protein